MKRILVTGAGGAPSTNFVRSLRLAPEKFYLVGTDANSYYLIRSETDVNYLVPSISDKNFLRIILQIIKKEKIDFIHIQNDYEIGWFSEHRHQIPANLYLPDKKTIRLCQDKFKSYLIWSTSDLPVPQTLPLKKPSDLKHAFKTLGSTLWLRSTTGAAGRGSLPTSDYNSAKAWIDFHHGWGSFTAAEKLTENSVTWMSIWQNGKLILAQGRKRLYWEMAKIATSGITGVTGGGETVDDPKLDELAIKSILAIDKHPHGLFGVDLTYDKKGIPNPTEINIGRFFTTHLFFTRAGVNMPYIFVKLAYREKVTLPQKPINPIPPGQIWIRGVDFLPILTNRATIVKYEKQFNKQINSL